MCKCMLITVSIWTNSSLSGPQAYTIWPSINRSSRPCLTLEQFATKAFKNASTKWIELTLIPGNHSLSLELWFENLECISVNAIMLGTRITCSGSGQLSLFNISKSLLHGIVLSGCQSISATDLKNLSINHCTFFLDGNGFSLLLISLIEPKLCSTILYFMSSTQEAEMVP